MGNSKSHYLTKDDILELSFYLPDMTIETAELNGYVYSDSYGAAIYSKGSVQYVFYDVEGTPNLISVISNEDDIQVMGIKINDTFEEALTKLPIEFIWNENQAYLIYGKMPSETDDIYPAHGNANINANGTGTITLVPEGLYPFVQFIFNEFKVIKINIICSDL
ncbi:MAG: hypothetical protein BGO41_10600 [Clostridiales bacterium 38-18]|nr:MAG: hypothetical protein BGO41_10600 [Clostridiales bacterium 38-18]